MNACPPALYPGPGPGAYAGAYAGVYAPRGGSGAGPPPGKPGDAGEYPACLCSWNVGETVEEVNVDVRVSFGMLTVLLSA